MNTTTNTRIQITNYLLANNNPEEGIFANRKVKLGIALIGSATSAYLIHNNLDLILNTTKSFLNRIIDYTSTTAFEFLNLLKTIWNNPTDSSSIILLGIFSFMTYVLILTTYKIYSANNKWLVFKLIISCAFTVSKEDAFELIKLSPETLDKIVTSNRWEAFQILNQLPAFSSKLLTKLFLANYPYDMLIKREAVFGGTEISFKYPLLMNHDEHGQQPIHKVLCYLSQFPELYEGNDSLPYKTLDTILSLPDPRPILEFLCFNTYLWKGSSKIANNMLLKLITNPRFKFIHEELGLWLSLVSEPNIDNAFIEGVLRVKNWSKKIRKKITDTCDKKQSDNAHKSFSLNMNKFFDDPDMDKWNMTRINENNTPADAINRMTYSCIFLNAIYSHFTSNKCSLDIFCVKCLQSSDAKEASQPMILRLVNILDYLDELTHGSITLKIEASRKFIAIIDIINIKENICSDGAIVALELAENVAKMFQHPKYMCNIILNMFKLNVIKAKLVNDNHVQNVHTFLYYLIKFNQYFALGHSTKTMAFEEHAQKTPLSEAMAKILDGFTAEDLIGFTANLDVFQLLFEAEAKNKTTRIRELMNDVYEIDQMGSEAIQLMIAEIQDFGIELEDKVIKDMLNASKGLELSHRLMEKLDNKRIRLEDHFYEDKATELFLQSEFIIKQI